MFVRSVSNQEQVPLQQVQASTRPMDPVDKPQGQSHRDRMVSMSRGPEARRQAAKVHVESLVRRRGFWILSATLDLGNLLTRVDC